MNSPNVESILNRIEWKDDKGIFDEKSFQIELLAMLGEIGNQLYMIQNALGLIADMTPRS